MKYKGIYFTISAILVGVSIIALVIWRVKPSIDFTGGALLEISISSDSVNSESLGQTISGIEGVAINSIQSVGKDNDQFVIRMGTIQEPQKNTIISAIEGEYSVEVVELRFETVGPTLGRELLIKTSMAVLVASLAILLYVAYQFKDTLYGVSAILAMFHDTIILAGMFSILGYLAGVEVDMLFVTALLTTLSFSVHDTIVVFDRVRETLRNNPHAPIDDVINKSITETLPRSLNNSLTIIIMLTALVLLGGDTIRWFVVALLIGTIAGTYSSTFVAAPVLDVLIKRFRK